MGDGVRDARDGGEAQRAGGAPEENGRGVCEEVRRRWRVAGLNRAEGGILRVADEALPEGFQCLLDTAAQVGWQQSAFGAGGLKFCGVAGDGLSGNPKSENRKPKEIRSPKGGVSGVSRLSPL